MFWFTGFFFMKFLSVSFNDSLYCTNEFLKFTHSVPIALLKLNDLSFIIVLVDLSVFNNVIPEIWLIENSSHFSSLVFKSIYKFFWFDLANLLLMYGVTFDSLNREEKVFLLAADVKIVLNSSSPSLRLTFK